MTLYDWILISGQRVAVLLQMMSRSRSRMYATICFPIVSWLLLNSTNHVYK
jgi:hypothetical protein